MSRLSFSDNLCTLPAAWSRLENLPLEIFLSITIHLTFFDKKALSSTSWRVYDLLGPVKPPDRFSWRLHLCSSFNRCTDGYFDVTIFKPDDVTRELTRITSQIAETPKRGHYVLDTTKTRLRDLDCLYFPAGFNVQYEPRRLVCRTLGHFVAIQFRAYVARLLWETRAERDSAFKQRYIDSQIDFNDEHKANLTNESNGWTKLRDRWMVRFSAPSSDKSSDEGSEEGSDDFLPYSAVGATEALVRRMGVQEIHGQRCGPVDNRGTEIRDPAGEVHLPVLIDEDGSIW
ncbi:MAG: hypothetical protein Q9209_000904 [Squamulea sp. 1 TL-2023]